ncbi:sensor histidine kinase [Leptolyngbya sp. AN02str]|uniref:sensor histidine kinase n=1 Tax=Leptolyngbya sp. AN02str TaxID=3423363 RepID=UPI003D31AB5C
MVLIVDDTPTNLEVLSEALNDAGFDVAIATTGDRALKQVERRIPDLILLDVMMPGIDGFETCRRLKANPQFCQIPIIFMTALSDPNSKVQALDLGAVDYIAKPFHEKEVIARVRTHLKLHYLTQTLETQVSQKTAELQASQLKLIQQEKMSALGNLVAGVAHEINNPIGCVLGNITAIQENIADLFSVIDLYRQHFPLANPEIEEKLEEIDLEYLREDLPKLVRAMKDGGDRIKSISQSLRTFSRADTDSKQKFNLHEGIDSTLLILHHRLKASPQRPEIDVIIDYGDLPAIECFPGQLNQVFMNILANAIDVFDEMAKNQSFTDIAAHPQYIKIRTTKIEDAVQICIRDNGKGMTEEVKAKIFDHLFTTKEVGKGTGLGLAIARQIILEKHNGTIEVHSAPGQGTELVIQLPC